jgi:hypothetical protein
VQIPDPNVQQAARSLKTGSANGFVADVPRVPVMLKFAEPELASQTFTIVELPDLAGLTTGSDGSSTVSVPIDVGTFTLAFPEANVSVECRVGNLDPPLTLSGVVQRLQNLGYLDPSVEYSADDIASIREALARLRAANFESLYSDDLTWDDADNAPSVRVKIVVRSLVMKPVWQSAQHEPSA